MHSYLIISNMKKEEELRERWRNLRDLGDNFVVSPLPVESSKYHSSCGGARFPFSENVIREKSNVCNHVYPESYGTSYSVNVITSQ